MATVYIDNKEYEVEEGKNMLEVCLSQGLDLTYFCWHPAMDSVGACRQCAVIQYKDEEDTQGKLAMACMLNARDGTRISLEDRKSKRFREGNIESLMLNHPHDCPVCDEGGECHLQDMTIMSGHNYRRSRFPKRTHENQYLGPFLNHEMNRCIQCYRCVRFYNDYAGGDDFDVFHAHDNVYFGRTEPGTLENEFSGNLVEICPTGVFTDKTLKKHYTRKWDLTNAPSVCHGCSLGCNILAGERYGTIRRVLTRYNGDVNGYFICDRGRFGYEYTNSDDRFTVPLKKEGENHNPISLEDLSDDFKGITGNSSKMIGIGSPRASLESNFILKELVGKANFYGGIPQKEGKLIQQVIDTLENGRVRTPSMKEAEKHDVVFVLGEDVTNTAPMLALALRQSAKQGPKQEAKALGIDDWDDAAIREVVQKDKGPFYLATTHSTKLDEIATDSFFGHPDDITRFGYAVAQNIDNQLPSVPGLDEGTQKLAQEIAEALLNAKKPLVVSGTSQFSADIIQSASDVAHALDAKEKDAGLIYTVPEVNSIGMNLLTDQFLDDAFDQISEEATLVVLENDLFERTTDKNAIQSIFEKAKNSIALDNLKTKTTDLADYIMPAGTFAESNGNVVSNEGRVQRFYQVHQPDNQMRSSWEWLDAIQNVHEELPPGTFDEVIMRMIMKHPELAKVQENAPSADFRKGTQKIPRQPHRYSGRTAMHAHKDVSEAKPPQDPDSPMSFTMEGYEGIPPSSNTAYYKTSGWNSVQAINKYQIEVGGPLHDGNPGVRLLEPSGKSRPQYTDGIPEAFKVEGDSWSVLPYYHIYGSEELTAKSPAVAERTPEAYIVLNTKEAENKGIQDDEESVTLAVEGQKKILKVQLDDNLPKGTAGLPKGLKETKGLQFPLLANIQKAND